MIQQLLLFLLLFPFLSLPPLSKPRQSLPPPSQTPILRPQNVISPTRTTTTPHHATGLLSCVMSQSEALLLSTSLTSVSLTPSPPPPYALPPPTTPKTTLTPSSPPPQSLHAPPSTTSTSPKTSSPAPSLLMATRTIPVTTIIPTCMHNSHAIVRSAVIHDGRRDSGCGQQG